MYMYAWKRGLKTTYYLRSRPATHISKTTVRAGVAGERGARPWPVRWKTRKPARPANEPACSTPALTSRCGPCATRKFYEMYRGAIKNTWSVEEIDFQIDLAHLQRPHERRRSAI